ncbi:MAG: histidine kinase, partial [Christensenella sp.]
FSTEKELIIANYSNAYNVYMIATIPNTYITEETMNIRLMIYMLTVPLLLLCVLLIALIYRSIMIPINRITQVCSVDEQKPLNRLVGDSSPDEIGFLARTIDEKTTKNLKLLDELDQNDRRKRELELEMLQYQINPHFLFNTLNTFKWIAALNNAPVLSSGLSSLAGLLKSTLMKKDEFIPLREEISNLEYYCVIQDLRYVGRFHVNFAIDEHTRECQIPRFILQPLVENAIVHGIGNIDAVMEIDVSSKIENEVLHLHIDDNGVGFDVENVMDQAREHFTGIGLSNVDERLKLHYGEKFGLTITSRKGNGTCCHITLPVAEQKRQRNSDA